MPYLGRFITRDIVLRTNQYIYAGNNPVNLVDPSGMLELVDDNTVYFPRSGNVININTGNVVEKVILTEKEKVKSNKKKNRGVVGIGYSTGAHTMGGISKGHSLYVDRSGNIALMKTRSITATTDFELSAALGGEISFNATNVKDMAGRSVVAGFGGDLPGGNYEYSMASPSSSITSHALAVSLNASVSPAEVHGGIVENEIVFIFNIKTFKMEYINQRRRTY